MFGADFEPHFEVPPRLGNKPSDLVEAVNDFHYAMMNDHPRNEFYRECLRRAIDVGESIVLEIGTGSGLLAMLAASLGARKVVALEASESLADLARRNIAENGMDDQITVINKFSTEVDPEEILAASESTDLPDVIVSELFGTLLLGESALEYLRNARNRLAAPHAKVVPPRGVQWACVVDCKDIARITRAHDWGGLSLRHANVLQDTVSVVFTKQYGFRFSSVPSTRLAPPVPVFEVDFAHDEPGFTAPADDDEALLDLVADHSGIAHCVLVYWDVTIGAPFLDGSPAPSWQQPDQPLAMSTDPRTTVHNFPRDMQWGQGIQLLEDLGAAERVASHDPDAALTRPPTTIAVHPGDLLQLRVKFSSDSVILQFDLRNLSTSSSGSSSSSSDETTTTPGNNDGLPPHR